MKNFEVFKNELKCYLANEKMRTLALVGAVLALGTLCFKEEVLAIDLRNRAKENNTINIESRNTILKASADGIDVVDITAPNKDGISHNKFIDLSVGTGNGIIFNNSIKDGQSEIGGSVLKNLNLKKEAKVILNEVTGATPSNINGYIEVFGKKADFILANENGIILNNAKFINAAGITLTTGKVSVNESKFDFDVQRGEVTLNGVESVGDYFNVYAKAIEIQQKLSTGEKGEEFDINILAGENFLQGSRKDLGKVDIVSSKETQSEKYGIYVTSLGAMYGKNIRLISTDSGLGVKHDGLIFNTKDMGINSNGDIVLKGKIASTKDLDIVATNDIIKNGKILGNGNISLSGKNIIMYSNSSNIWTRKKLNLSAEGKIYNVVRSNVEDEL